MAYTDRRDRRMTPEDLMHDLRGRINPVYRDIIGTESWERNQCADAIELLLAEKEAQREFIDHVARCSCHCQKSSLDVAENKHYPSCWVGKAQRHLGQRVSEKLLYGGVK